MLAEADKSERDCSLFPVPCSLRMAFVMEQQAGMRTQYQNWRRVVEQEEGIAATWIPITYWDDNGLLEKLKFVPGSIRSLLRSRQQTRDGLGSVKYDAILFNTHNPAVTYQKPVRTQRTFLMFDVTPKQYDGLVHWYGFGQKADKPGLYANWKHAQVCQTFQAAEGLFAWSNWARQSAIDDYGADPAKVHLVPPGVDTSLWHPNAAQKPNDGVTRILFTGGNFERKGGDLLLKWARETQRKNWELHLVTIDKIEDIPAGVIVHNNVGSNAVELIRLAQQCDIFALPTRADCFSIASLEAMAAGLPVIVTNIGGISDIVREGETGHLIAAENYEMLGAKLESLMDAPETCRQMGQRGREVVCERFELADTVRSGLKLMAGR